MLVVNDRRKEGKINLKRIFTNARRQKMNSLQELGKVWLEAKKEISQISFVKNALNSGKRNHYITLDAINKELEPILIRHDLSFQVMKRENDIFTGTLVHLPSMQEYTCSYGKIELSPIAKKSDGTQYEIMNTAQAQGATLTYARRYIISCFFNLVVDCDSDAEILTSQEYADIPF